MKSHILALAALAATAAACVQENHSSVEFRGICANPAPDTSTGGCVYDSTCGAYALFTYWYDPSVAAELLVPIEMFNQLPDNTDLSIGRLNTNDAVIQQWRFEYLLGGFVVLEEAAEDNLVVPAASHTVALVPVIPSSLNALVSGLGAGSIVVNIRAAGRYLDERYFETGPFKVPAEFCNGCYTPPITCTTQLLACPQTGQTGSYVCQS